MFSCFYISEYALVLIKRLAALLRKQFSVYALKYDIFIKNSNRPDSAPEELRTPAFGGRKYSAHVGYWEGGCGTGIGEQE